MTIDLTEIVLALLSVLMALVTRRLIPWLNSKTSEQQRRNLQAMVRVLVTAAEQLYQAGEGERKLTYVEDQLKRAGYTMDMVGVRNMIEAEVHRLAV
ncbi:MAG: phage holin family protein [Oscillospiraceae bacterium]|jgi:competence protein ComGC|nr:phage holin family protein [Oscillospiraceae bacterium]